MPQARAHPYIPNSVPRVRAGDAGGRRRRRHVDELYASIPERLRFPRLLDLPPALDPRSRCAARWRACWRATRQHPRGAELPRRRAAGSHHVPAVVDEIVNRAEFVTAYYGETYGDHGKLQALFEFASLIGELVELDAVAQPTYDWATAAASAIAMAARVTGRRAPWCRRRWAPSAWR